MLATNSALTFGTHHSCFRHGLRAFFLRRWRTPSWDMEGVSPNSTTWPAKRRRVQCSCPSGGSEQARAMRWASPRSSSFRYRWAWAGLAAPLPAPLRRSGRWSSSPNPEHAEGRARKVPLIGYLLAFGAACCYRTTNGGGEAVDHQLHFAAGGGDHQPVLRDAAAGPGGVPAGGAPCAGLLVHAGLSGLEAATGVNWTYMALQRADVVVASPMVSARPLSL